MLSLSSEKKINSIARCQTLLGTFVEINIASRKTENQLLEMTNIAFSKIKEIESLMSFHDKNSELSYLNREAFKSPCSISSQMNDVLSQALLLSDKTDGMYDISIASKLMEQELLPTHYPYSDMSGNWKDIVIENKKIKFNKEIQIDLGGIAKGYAIDQALKLIEDDDSQIAINAGGDLVMSNWESEIAAIKFSNQDVEKSVPMQRKALATSACYYLGGKSAIISPSRKKPILSDDTISVFAPNCMLADALTKVAFLQRENCLDLLTELDAVAIKTSKNGSSHYFSGELL